MIRRTVTLLLLVLLPFAACTTVPETPRERLVAAELSYQAAVGTIRDMAVAGQIREEHAPRLRAGFLAPEPRRRRRRAGGSLRGCRAAGRP
jgi:hypothetical protein